MILGEAVEELSGLLAGQRALRVHPVVAHAVDVAVLDGDLQAVIDSDIQADEADRLANQK